MWNYSKTIEIILTIFYKYKQNKNYKVIVLMLFVSIFNMESLYLYNYDIFQIDLYDMNIVLLSLFQIHFINQNYLFY
jgi:hypothetical protein